MLGARLAATVPARKIPISTTKGSEGPKRSAIQPAVGIDAAQSAQMIAKIGVLGATGGGLAVLGGALIASSGEASAPCTFAMRAKAVKTTPDAGVANDIGKALGKLFGR